MTFDRDLKLMRRATQIGIWLNLGMAAASVWLHLWWHIPAWLIWAWNCVLVKRQVTAQQLTRDEARVIEVVARSIQEGRIGKW